MLCTLLNDARDAGTLGIEARDIVVAARGLCARYWGSGFQSSLFSRAFILARWSLLVCSSRLSRCILLAVSTSSVVSSVTWYSWGLNIVLHVLAHLLFELDRIYRQLH